MSQQVVDSTTVKSAFGAQNRERLINKYFSQHPETCVSGAQAWKHVYRLLLWVDQTTGLAHCYESDKSQPGKRWYARSLAFHDWASTALKTSPSELASSIDWLFLHAAEDLSRAVLKTAEKVATRANDQRAPYAGRNFPRPGEDTELINIITNHLDSYFSQDPPPEVWNNLVAQIRQYLALENKRKNLVGEGFEDVLTQIIRRSCNRNALEVDARRPLHDIPGFARARAGDKVNKVDVSIIRPGMRTLVTAKWSVRADREKQFTTDFADYIAAESDRAPFEYVFITNEFDPARLMRACEQLSGNAPMFNSVVHINTDAIRATYGLAPDAREAASMTKVINHIDSGRLISLEQWLDSLGKQ